MQTYREALDYLEQHANYEQNRSAQYAPETFSLARMQQVLDRLGNPHRQFKSVHVAGTKGKGSTCRMIESVLRVAGYRTGLYTSPHLHTFCERIQVDSQQIPRDEVVALVNELEPHVESVPGLTYFEIVTAMSFLHLARQQAQVAVVEVGLGGRLDATNVITPQVSVITSLSYDHTAWLGNTLDKIAFEKAGIIKPGVPVVSAPQALEALAVVERVATERNARLVLVGRDWLYAPGLAEPGGQWFARMRPDWHTNFWPAPEFYWIPLLGRHQAVNATVALSALDALRESGMTISTEAVREGLLTTHWPARLEVASRKPLVVIDGAHNGESAQRLAAALREWFPGRVWTLVFGASSDKDFAVMFDHLLPIASRVILTRSQSARAADPVRLGELVASRGSLAEVSESVASAMDSALRKDDGATSVIVTGSLFIAAEAQEAWAARVGAPPFKTDYD